MGLGMIVLVALVAIVVFGSGGYFWNRRRQ